MEKQQPQPQLYPPPQPSQQGAQQQQATVVVVNQPAVATNAYAGAPQNIRDWSSGICGCLEDCNSCCYAYWCYPCFLCALATKMDECYCGPTCCAFTTVHGCMSLWGVNLSIPSNPNVFLVGMRSKLRAQYGIEGGICCDVCCVWCCPFCASTQMMRELKHVARA